MIQPFVLLKKMLLLGAQKKVYTSSTVKIILIPLTITLIIVKQNVIEYNFEL